MVFHNERIVFLYIPMNNTCPTDAASALMGKSDVAEGISILSKPDIFNEAGLLPIYTR